jgi:hypothetical protein
MYTLPSFLVLLNRILSYHSCRSIANAAASPRKRADRKAPKKKISVAKFHYFKGRPRLLKIMREAFYERPDELKKVIGKNTKKCRSVLKKYGGVF